MRPCDLRLEHIAEAVGVPLGRLFAISEDTAPFYKPTRRKYVPGGKLRQIDEPKPWFKGVLRKLHKFLQRNFAFHPAAHGGVTGRSCFTAANLHLGRFAVATRDVSDCFPSVTTQEMRKRLLDLGFRFHVAHLLARLLTHKNCIPQGSPISNDALNFCLYDLDAKATSACGRDVVYTRTADDHVISSDNLERLAEISDLVEREIADHGLTLNEKKRTRNGLVVSPSCQLVHSIAVNHSRGTRINPAYAADYTELAHRYVRAARSVSAESLQGVARLRRKLAGSVNYCRQAHFSPASNLTRLLRTGDRLVERKLSQHGVTRSRKWWVSNKRRDRAKEYASIWRSKGH